MSDYYKYEVIRAKATPEFLKIAGVEDIWDLETKYSELFNMNELNNFEIAPTEGNFVDFVISCELSIGEYGFSRKLTQEEIDKYLPLFKKINSSIESDDLRHVDYCFYNCCEAPDYF